MSCSQITAGISRGCNNNLGGIRKIYIADQPITSYTIQGNVITNFQPTPTWLEVEADNGTGNFQETYEITQSGSIVAYKQSVTFQANDLSAYNQQRIQELAESTHLGVVVEMNNGKLFTVGIERGAYLETASTSSGTQYGDLSGSTITITGMEQISTLEVSPLALSSFRFDLTYDLDNEFDSRPNDIQYAKCTWYAEMVARAPGYTTISIARKTIAQNPSVGDRLYLLNNNADLYTTGTYLNFRPNALDPNNFNKIVTVSNGLITGLYNLNDITCP